MRRKNFPRYHIKAISVILVSFALASCIADPKTEFLGPNGKTVYSITCETSVDCKDEARRVCPGQHHLVPVASGSDDTSAKGGIGLTSVGDLGDTSVQRLAIECE